MKRLRLLCNDDRGAIVSMEIVFVATILVIAVTAAWFAVRDSVIGQISDQAKWISGEEINNQEEAVGLDEIVTCADVFGPN